MKRAYKGSVLKYVTQNINYNSAFDMAESVTEQELRQVHSDLRSIARKRAKRLKDQKKYNVEKQIKGLENDSMSLKELEKEKGGKLTKLEIAKHVDRLRRRLEGKQTKITDIERSLKDTLRSLNDAGINVDKNNLDDFGLFMEVARSMWVGSLYDSREVAEAYDQYVKDGDLSIVDWITERFEDWALDQDVKEVTEDERFFYRGKGHRGRGRMHRKPVRGRSK